MSSLASSTSLTRLSTAIWYSSCIITPVENGAKGRPTVGLIVALPPLSNRSTSVPSRVKL